MTDNTATTNVFLEKVAKAHGDLDAVVLGTVAQIGFGDGGHDGGGDPIPPTGAEVALASELERVAITDVTYDAVGGIIITATLGFDDQNGEVVSEVGLFDSDAELVGIRTFAPIFKTDDLRIDVVWREAFS